MDRIRLAGSGRGRMLRAGALAAALAGSAFADDAPRPPQLRFHRLTADQGLSDSTVEAILQDSRGFIWVGTADGLNRYDGYDFEVYSPDDAAPDSIVGGYVWDLLEDTSGNLWVGTSLGLSRYVRATDSFVSFVHDPQDESSLSNANAQEIFEDSRGDLWVGTGVGLNRLDLASGSFVRYLHDPEDDATLGHDNVQVVFEDSRGRLWVGTQGGLDLLDRDSGAFSHYRHDPEDPASLSHNFIRSIEEDRFGDIWVGTEVGLNRLRRDVPGSFERYLYDPDDPASIQDEQVWAVLEDSQGVLWIGTDRGGLAYYDRARRAFVHYLHDPVDPLSISSNAVYVICEDASGDLWTGNYAGGVNLVDRASTAFEFYTHVPGDPQSLSHQSVLSFLEDRSGRIWVGTEDGLAAFDRAERRFSRYRHDPRDPASLPAPAVLSLHEDRDGGLWVGTYNGGLSRFDPGTGTFTRLVLDQEDSPSAERSQVWTAVGDRHGFLWVGTSGGLYRVDRATGDSVLYRGDPAQPGRLRHDYIWALCEDGRGRLWVGTHDGLALYDRERDAFDSYWHDPADATSLSFSQITAIREDLDGRIWIGTHGGGLNLLDARQRTFSAVGLEEGLPSDVVLSVAPDGDGFLWLGTNKGLSRFDPRTGELLNLDQNDGLQGSQFNRGAALRARDGTLFFGGINGFNVFDPGAVQPNRKPPPVVLTGFEIFNQSVPVGEGSPLRKQISEAELITLRHEHSVLTFEFAALNYRNSGRNEYAYMLEGFDAGWVRAGTKRSATYTNLDPGSYTFRVKGSNNSGVWNERGASIRLVVLPPLWATWWFRLLGALALIGLILAAYRLRVRRITNQNLLLQAEIRERQRAEEERARLLVEMEAKNVMLEQQSAELERFAYTVSHDLKSPLVTIHGFVGLLEKDVEAGDLEGVRKSIRHIGEASATMSRLLRDVLELSRVGRVANPSEGTSLSELARQAATIFAGQLEERGVELDIDPEMPTVVGDRLRLFEVFQNLIGNALKFMGGQARPRISIGAHQEDGQVVCFVRDNGRGIDPRYHGKIFGLFQRLDLESEGSGIGLALVRRIVEVHGGRVWVDSEGQGSGSTFWFSLAHPPRERPAE